MKQVIALVTALADLAGEWPLEKVIATLSDFADEALDLAIATAIRERAPDAEPRGLALIGLGKHGSRELNYSSDVDPMLIYDPALLPLRRSEEHTSELQSRMRISYAVFCLKKTNNHSPPHHIHHTS